MGIERARGPARGDARRRRPGSLGATTIEEVIPDLVPKAELPLAPESEINVSYAPSVPPPSERMEPAIVEVAFEVVEGVADIDPINSVQYLTWGYRRAGR